MKKLVCIALFSFAMMANATERNEIETNNSKEVKTEKSTVKKAEKTSISEEDFFWGCGSEGNAYYSTLRSEGMDHRDARSARRAFVRKCRGGGWKWVAGIYTFGTIGL